MEKSVAIGQNELDKILSTRTNELEQAYEAMQRQQETINRDLAMAKEVQGHIVAQATRMPAMDGVNFGTYYRSMDMIGGDMMDATRMGKNAFGALMADVSGHGIAAALISVMVKVGVASRAGWQASPGEILTDLNTELLESLKETHKYVTAYLAVFNLEEKSVHFANCAHHPTLLFRDQEFYGLDTKGRILGLFDDIEVEERQISLKKGDLFVLYTDGMIETRNPFEEEFGRKRLCDAIAAHRHLGAQGLCDKIVREVELFSYGADPKDDMSLMIIEYTG